MPLKDPLPLLSQEELERRFTKMKPLMNGDEAGIESSRCLFCHDAPCIKACPSSIDIPMFIRQIMSKNTKGAAKTIFSQNILGKSCGDVCPTEVLCEGACVYNDMNKHPIDIGRLQSYATSQAIKKGIRFFTKGRPTGKKVAIIGGGPAGLTCAHELSVLGHEAIVFEASRHPGGLNTYGVAPYKLSNEEALAEVAYVQDIGFEIKTNHPITVSELTDMERTYDAIFLGVGLGGSVRPGLPGEEKDGVWSAAEFIYKLRAEEQRISVGQRTVVVGGGNTAIDAAVECAKLGTEVTNVYRRGKKEQKAYFFEVELARQHGVRFVYFTSPLEVLGNASVTGLKCTNNEVKGSECTFPCDMVIFATGQEKQVEFLKAIPGVELDVRGCLKINADFQTTNPKYFAGGDAVNGGKEVVNAVAHGRDAARGIDRFLKRQTGL